MKKKILRGFHGRYDFSNMEDICKCGHKLGDHCMANPTGLRDCMVESMGGPKCNCEAFRPNQPKH